MNHYVYILKSLKVKRFYVGYTTDLDRRVLEHNKGNTKSTRPFGPWKMIYHEVYGNRSDAYKREWHLKHSAGHKEKLEIIKQFGGIAPHSPKAKQAPLLPQSGMRGIAVMYFTYILKSKKDGKYYYGSTIDIEKRLFEHNNRKVIATKDRAPFGLHYFEKYNTRKEAARRELFFKKRSGYKWLKDNWII